MARDPLAVIETAYQIESDDWLRQVAESVYRELGAGLGLLAFSYRVIAEERIIVGSSTRIAMDEVPEISLTMMEQLPPDFVRKSFVRCECATQSQAADAEMKALLEPMMETAASAFGWRDVLMLGGMDPNGDGVYFGVWLPEKTTLAPAERATWNRVAAHLVAGQRLRRRITAPEQRVPDAADAILRPDGMVEHATGEAELADAREALSQAVRAVENARRNVRRIDAGEAVGAWKVLVSTRWSLVDHFESDGNRYVLARRNDVPLRGYGSLTEREHQAVCRALLGHTNKLIAYDMGISASTVGVLLHRAARKLDAKSRGDLIAKYRRATTTRS
ncbi:MAG TPA: LuxR C-terminal-related transcriptional regulator [Polyangia bacterium]